MIRFKKNIKDIKDNEGLYLRYAHWAVLLIGAIFLLSGVFHKNIWFDEAYTVALLRHPLGEMIQIASDDVHPFLYYVVAWFVYYPTKSIILLRLLSALFSFLLALLGYTHIRRDFGDRVGLWFSLLTFLLASTVKYAGQMRMYTLAALLVMLTAIYAYRYGHSLLPADDDGSDRGGDANFVFFILLSVASAYTHHFALAAVCFINLCLLCFILINKRSALKAYLGAAIAQLVLYVPGFLTLLHQMKMGGAADIRMEWSQVLLDTLAFHFLGDQKENAFDFSYEQYRWIWISALLITACMVGALVYAFIKKRPHRHAVAMSAGVYFGVLLAAWAFSLFKRPIFLERYTMVMYGLWILGMAYAFAHIRFPAIKGVLIAGLVCILVVRVAPLYRAYYGPELGEFMDYMEEYVEEGDTFGFDNYDDIKGFRLSVYFPEHKQYFYNINHWNIEDAYRAFGNVEIFRWANDAGNYPGDYGDRIWVLDRNSFIYWELINNYHYTEVQSETFYFPYYNCTYEMILLTK